MRTARYMYLPWTLTHTLPSGLMSREFKQRSLPSRPLSCVNCVYWREREFICHISEMTYNKIDINSNNGRSIGRTN